VDRDTPSCPATSTVGDVDFSSREWTGVFEPLKDPRYFAQVRVDPEASTIVWPGGLDMASRAAVRGGTAARTCGRLRTPTHFYEAGGPT
jgi:Protein of unknown function (DUF2442)